MNRWLVCAVVAVLVVPFAPALAQGHGGGGGGAGCGDVFGDLIHIKRAPGTGQPILQKRWIEYPQDTYGWGYCPIPVGVDGQELPFADLSCDPLDPAAVVEVDYFGRLSGGRTKERNQRMHFDEVISSIKTSGAVKQDETGRLMLGYDCTSNPGGQVGCDTWAVVDSPMESLGLYARLLRYGHLQTDPLEVDTWAHGDPEAGTQYHPALGPEDWGKLAGSLRHLLPGSGWAQPAHCFGEAYLGGFNPACARPEALASRDTVRAASFLAGAADKTGKITVDLVQYMNRILKIALDTEASQATVDTLPALVRDCGPDPDQQITDVALCPVAEAPAGLPAPANELFLDFSRTSYERAESRDGTLLVIRPAGAGLWQEVDGVPVAAWLDFVNGPSPTAVQGVDGFVAAASDALRSIEFVHNYAIPDDLGWNFEY